MSKTAPLPFRAPLRDYEQEAAALLSAVQSQDTDALWKFKWEHPRFRGKPVADVKAATLDIDDARLVVARKYAFGTWQDLERFTDAVTHDRAIDRFERAVEAVIAGDVATLGTMLGEYPELARARSVRRHHATLLHYSAANGVEGYRQKTPPNAVEVAKLLLDAGSEVDALADMYDVKCTPMSMLVSSTPPADAGLQTALAETLLDYGAALAGPGSEWESDLLTALSFGFLKTAQALAERGATVDHLPAAAGLGRIEETKQLLPNADQKSKHVALAMAAQHGHREIVRLLLDAGEDPNRYNPKGYHDHSTPLHQAIAAGHLNVVQLLIERGARADIPDTIYDGTALGWAVHCEQPAIADFLRSVQKTSD
jgi:ankyrin repeat protein